MSVARIDRRHGPRRRVFADEDVSTLCSLLARIPAHVWVEEACFWIRSELGVLEAWRGDADRRRKPSKREDENL